MARAIFKVFFKIIVSLTNALLTPVFSLLGSLFPDLSLILTKFNYVVNNYFGAGLTWFWNIIPTGTQSLITLYLTIMITYYTISISVHAILKVFAIIKRIKIW